MKFLNLQSKVKQIIANGNEKYLEYIEGTNKSAPVLFNQRETLRRINFYLNNKYLVRDDNAIFWNIINHRINHFAKLISPDTKDFYPYGLGEINFWTAWALRKKVKQFFDDSEFYKVLNDLAEGIATYGSTVWKKYKKDGRVKIKEVKLDNLYFDQAVENIEDTDVVELHYLSHNDLYQKKDIWENVEKVLECKEDRVEIWEYYGSWEEDDMYVYKHTIGYGYGDESVILWEEEMDKKDCPYVDFHLGRYRGRWMRVGVPERLFKLQERANQLVNQNAATTEIASLLLLKSDSPDATGNVLEQAVNGQIIADATLQQIGITNTGLTLFIQELQLIEQQADKACLTPEIIQGEASPANTTFRGIAVVNAGAVTAFKNYRQNIFEKIAHLLLTDVFPDLVKDWNKGDIIEMAEDDVDIQEYDKVVKSKMEREYLLSGIGNVITPEIQELISQVADEEIQKKGRRIKIEKGLFNFKWGFKMMATDESVDKSAKNDAYYNALQMMALNPALIDTPLFRQYLEDNGISYWKLKPQQKQELMQQAGRSMPEPKKPDQLLAQAQPVQ